MPNCEGRSRRGGVILYSMVMKTAILWPTPHQSGQARQLPLQGEAFWWPFYPNIISRCVCSLHSTNAPVARRCNRRRTCGARPRGKAGSERRKACFHPGGSGFHLPRTLENAIPLIRFAALSTFPLPGEGFYTLLLYKHSAAFTLKPVLCFFLDSRKKRTSLRNP